MPVADPFCTCIHDLHVITLSPLACVPISGFITGLGFQQPERRLRSYLYLSNLFDKGYTLGLE